MQNIHDRDGQAQIVASAFLGFFMLMGGPSVSQSTSFDSTGSAGQTRAQPSDSTYELSQVQEQPEYPGGQEGMFRFIGQHLRYPTDIEVQGKVVVEFVIDTTGAVVEARSIRGISGSALDNEAIRVVMSMPKWTPGRIGGRNVRTRFVLPVYIDPR